MKWSEWTLFVTSEIKLLSLDFTQGLTVKTKTLPLKIKTKTIFLVLEVPQDQDQSLKDYSTD